MADETLSIGYVAKMLGVSIQTVRRWDDSGRLPSIGRRSAEHRRYSKQIIENYVRENIKKLDLYKMGRNWAAGDLGVEPLSDFYCADISVFQARLTKLEKELGAIKRINRIFPLMSAITGEIGGNSFDHNLGNWPDVRGIFFIWDLDKGKIVLADRGQGIFATLQRVKPELRNHQEALRTAFTEIISGRSPEYRGNGLKFVKNVVINNKINLFFQTGDASLRIKKGNPVLDIKKSTAIMRGCLALIKF